MRYHVCTCILLLALSLQFGGGRRYAHIIGDHGHHSVVRTAIDTPHDDEKPQRSIPRENKECSLCLALERTVSGAIDLSSRSADFEFLSHRACSRAWRKVHAFPLPLHSGRGPPPRMV